MSANDNFQCIINLLQCPRCENTMSPPILMCSMGHNICHVCRPVLQNCYICRNVITNQRNDFAENMSKLIPTKCRFSRYGCREQVNHEQRPQHEDTCPYQPVECLAGNWKDTVVKCGWQGKQSELLEHVRLVHGIQWVHVGPTMEGAEFCCFDSSTIKIVLLCAFEELFWLTVKHDVDSDTHIEVLQYVGPRSRAKLFTYEIELKFLNGSTKSTRNTRTCFEDVNEILAAKSNIYSSTCSFFTSYMKFRRYKFTVHKVLPP